MDKTTAKLTLAHSPDSDDAFMFWALSKGLVDTEGLEFVHILKDIQSLNQAAIDRKYDITAISLHAYPYIANDYALLNVGASVGDGYGPIIVTRKEYSLDELERLTIAIPGSLTTAALVLRLALPGVRTEDFPFDQISEAVVSGEVDAGVIIHEGQITYMDDGLVNSLDLGKWWKAVTGLPLPLGANAIRRGLGPELMQMAASAIRSSIEVGFSQRKEAIEYASDYGRNISRERVDRFVSMYVNDFTMDWGEHGRNAVRKLLGLGADAGIVPPVEKIDFIG